MLRKTANFRQQVSIEINLKASEKSKVSCVGDSLAKVLMEFSLVVFYFLFFLSELSFIVSNSLYIFVF